MNSTKYLYSVLTHKHLQITTEEFLTKLSSFIMPYRTTEYPPAHEPIFYIVRENGRNNDNPHYNIIEKTDTRQDNRRRQFVKFYEKNGWEVTKHSIRVTKVVDIIQLIAGYLRKEENYIVTHHNKLITDEMRKKIKEFEEEMPYPKHLRKKVITYEQAPDVIYQTIKFLYPDENQIVSNDGIAINNTRVQFREAIHYLIRHNYEMKNILNNISHIWIRIESIASNSQMSLEMYINKQLTKDIYYLNN